MTNIPDKSELTSGSSTTEADFQGGMNKIVDFLTELAIHGDPEEINIPTSGLIVPTKASVSIDTESGTALTDNLDGIETTNIGKKMLIIRPKTSARIVTMRHNQSVSGKLWLLGEADFVLRDPSYCSILVWNSTASRWDEISRNVPNFVPTAEQSTIRTKLGLGTASTKNTGISTGQIPLIDNLGTAALVNTGTGSGQVPLSNQLGSLAFLSSVTDAQLSTSGVTPGTYNSFTVNAQGRVTAATNENFTGTAPITRVYTSSGTWTKPAGLVGVRVTCTGAGASGNSGHGAGSNGGSSSFGGYCSAGGGNSGGTTGIEGLGGAPSNGTGSLTPIAIFGGDGSYSDDNLSQNSGKGGSSYWGGGGRYHEDGRAYGSGGGCGTIPSGVMCAGGAGATIIKDIAAADLSSSVSITVGVGGAASSTATSSQPAGSGAAGIVIVEEYY